LSALAHCGGCATIARKLSFQPRRGSAESELFIFNHQIAALFFVPSPKDEYRKTFMFRRASSCAGAVCDRPEMTDAAGQDGWTTVLHQPSEEQQISKWEQLEGHWSGEGKHPNNWTGHSQVRVVDRELGQGSFGAVERVTYKAVTMARK
jgi:hypothetical protein